MVQSSSPTRKAAEVHRPTNLSDTNMYGNARPQIAIASILGWRVSLACAVKYWISSGVRLKDIMMDVIVRLVARCQDVSR